MSGDICFMTATDMAAAIRAGRLSAREVMAAHLDADRARQPASQCDRHAARRTGAGRGRRRRRGAGARARRSARCTACRSRTRTCSSRAACAPPMARKVHEHFIPTKSALLVERQQAAGAISIGKTNTPEFGAGSQTFNAVFGATRNPYDLSKTCGGSSGGAAVALATGMVPLADGSDTGGSLRCPASFCNVVGLRPAVGRVPQFPALGGWDALSVSGPMARTVADLALYLSVLAGPDARDPLAIAEDGARFARPLERDFKGVRIALSADMGGLPIEARGQAAGGGATAGIRGAWLRGGGSLPGFSRRAGNLPDPARLFLRAATGRGAGYPSGRAEGCRGVEHRSRPQADRAATGAHGKAAHRIVPAHASLPGKI